MRQNTNTKQVYLEATNKLEIGFTPLLPVIMLSRATQPHQLLPNWQREQLSEI